MTLKIDHLLDEDPPEPLQTGKVVDGGPYQFLQKPDGTRVFLTKPKDPTRETSQSFFKGLGRKILSRATATLSSLLRSS